MKKKHMNWVLLLLGVFMFFQIVLTAEGSMTKGDWFGLMLFEFALQGLWETNRNKLK